MAARQPQHLGFDSRPGLRARGLGSDSLRLVRHPLRRPDLAGPVLRQVVQQNPELVRKGPPPDPPREVGDDAEVLLPQLRSQVKIFLQYLVASSHCGHCGASMTCRILKDLTNSQGSYYPQLDLKLRRLLYVSNLFVIPTPILISPNVAMSWLAK